MADPKDLALQKKFYAGGSKRGKLEIVTTWSHLLIYASLPDHLLQPSQETYPLTLILITCRS